MPLSVFSRFFAAFVLSMAVSAPASGAEMVVDKIVAQVNGEIVTLFELNEKVQAYVAQVEKRAYNPADPALKELKERILKTMIEDIMLKQEAARMKVQISDSEVESRIREIREKGGLSEAQFVQQLRLEGMTRKQFAEAIKKDILKKQLLGYMVQRKVVVSEEEIKQYFEANKSGLSAPRAGSRIGLIMLTKMDEAKALRQKIASGQITFADAARKFSVGPGAEQGGDLGKVEIKDLAPEMRTALQNVNPGGVSEPVLLDGKPVLLTIAAEKEAAQAPAPSAGPSLDAVRDEIYEKLYREKLEKQFTDYMDRLRAKSVIKVNL
ncbi:MAG: SurA N-terminal domain-containing protein [Thermodesulfobacteriota bacterium]